MFLWPGLQKNSLVRNDLCRNMLALPIVIKGFNYSKALDFNSTTIWIYTPENQWSGFVKDLWSLVKVLEFLSLNMYPKIQKTVRTQLKLASVFLPQEKAGAQTNGFINFVDLLPRDCSNQLEHYFSLWFLNCWPTATPLDRKVKVVLISEENTRTHSHFIPMMFSFLFSFNVWKMNVETHFLNFQNIALFF